MSLAVLHDLNTIIIGLHDSCYSMLTVPLQCALNSVNCHLLLGTAEQHLDAGSITLPLASVRCSFTVAVVGIRTIL